MTAYYNETDPYAAAWLRNLIAAGHIAPGVVDERDVRDVRPDELAGFTQCHFFAGIGVWSYSLRLAGWPDDRPVWTGSCPCQPFSAAGKGLGFADERHLWPAWFWLIEQCRPRDVLGEQVASKDGDLWLDLVQADMEGTGYAFGPHVSPSAGFGAPHGRHRIRFAAVDELGDTQRRRAGSDAGNGNCPQGSIKGSDGRSSRSRIAARNNGASDELGFAPGSRSQRFKDWRRDVFGSGGTTVERASREPAGRLASGALANMRDRDGRCGERGAQKGTGRTEVGRIGHSGGCAPIDLADDASCGRREKRANDRRELVGDREEGFAAGSVDGRVHYRPGPTNGFWRDADWLACRDGKWRPVEPGTFPLAHGAPARVGRLRAYGNAVDAQATAHFIEAFLESERVGHLQLGVFA